MLSENFQTQKVYSSEICDEYSLINSFGKKDGFKESGQALMDHFDMDLLESLGSGQEPFYGSVHISKSDLSESDYQINPQLQDQCYAGFVGCTDDINLDLDPQNLLCGNYGFKKNSDCMDCQYVELTKQEEGHELFPSTPFGILKKYKRRFKMLNGEKLNLPISYEKEQTLMCRVSIEQIIHLASQKFVQSTLQDQDNEISILNHPYPSSILHQDSDGSVELVQNLLSLAEKIGERQFERARKILEGCEKMASPNGSPIKRLVFYFIEALYERIDRETGTISQKGLANKVEDPIQSLRSPKNTLIALHKELPLSQMAKFAGIQAVVDNVADARKVHYIDFEIRTGVQCTILMQALANRSQPPIQRLKITAVGTKSREGIEETGRHLMTFAQTLNLEFSFNVVMVDSILDLDESLFGIENDEAIAVYAAFAFNTMIGQPNQLEHLMRVIKIIHPRVMVVTEIEADCNNPNFLKRFVEALFFYGAFFESLAECFKNNEQQRVVVESTCSRTAIRNIVGAEGDERNIRHVGIRVWRAFFTRFGFVEMNLSMSSVYQANLVAKNFECGTSFTVAYDDKSCIIGWKGTPIISLSAWKVSSV